MRAHDDLSLTRAIDRYVSSLEGAGYSPNTLKAYATRLNDFATWVAGPVTDLPLDQPAPHLEPLQDAETIQSYLASLRRRRIGRRVGVSTQTLHHAYAVLSGFYRWLDRTLGLEPNPSLRTIAEHVPAPWNDLLVKHHETLLGLVTDLRGLSDANRELIQSGLAAIDEALLSVRPDAAPTYTAAGRTASRGSRSMTLDGTL